MAGETILLARSGTGRAALEAACSVAFDAFDAATSRIVLVEISRELQRERFLSTYERICSVIELAMSERGYGKGLTIISEGIDPQALEIGSTSTTWESLIAMLVLTFPEVSWGFATGGEKCGATILGRNWFIPQEPIFDGNGLRELVKENTFLLLADLRAASLSAASKRTSGWTARQYRAAVIDEEEHAALFQAYAAFRFGFRVTTVTTWTKAVEVFGTKVGPHDFQLILEDMNLNFADSPSHVHLSLLGPANITNSRAAALRQLASELPEVEVSKRRLLVTTGYSPKGSLTKDDPLRQNQDYLRSYKGANGYVVPKPLGGLFDFRKNVELGSLIRTRQERPEDFESSHGAPGRLQLVARKLLDQSRIRMEKEQSPVGHIVAAVCATEALELIRFMTPTLALEALCLQHEAEVIAETESCGVMATVGMSGRLEEIEAQCRELVEYFSPAGRHVGRLSAELRILGRLARVLQNANRFEEETKCRDRATRVMFELWLSESFKKVAAVFDDVWKSKTDSKGRTAEFMYTGYRWLRGLLPIQFTKRVGTSAFNFALRVPFYYFVWTTRSLGRFTSAIVVWVMLLAIAFKLSVPTENCVGYDQPKCPDYGMASALSDALSSLLSMGAPFNPTEEFPKLAKLSPRYVWIANIADFLGVVHLGLFATLLFNKLTRR